MAMNNTCETCGHWRRFEDKTIGTCKLIGKTRSNNYTVSGYGCDYWAAKGGAKTTPSGGFDVDAAIAKLAKRKPDSVSIEVVHHALRCTYRQAAEVVGEMVARGLIE